MEHLRHEFDRRRLVRVVLRELDGQLEGPALPGSVIGTEDHAVPKHDVVVLREPRHTLRGILTEPPEVAHDPTPSLCGHSKPICKFFSGKKKN